MELKPILSAKEAAFYSAREIGGKAANLSIVTSLGFAVPDYIIVSTKAWQEQLNRTGLANWLENQLTKIQQVQKDNAEKVSEIADKIYQTITLESLYADFKVRLLQELHDSGFSPETTVAVRSSIADEDSADASFAGQMDSFMCVNGIDGIAGAIVKCWASAYSERALRYRLHLGLQLQNIGIAVIVQKMVAGEVSGVLFTAHPVTGSRQQALLTAAFGLGEGVVSGECAADEFTYCYLTQEITNSKIATKEIKIGPAEYSGVIIKEVNPEEQRKPSLTASQIKELVLAGATIADFLGHPQDIEWTLHNGTLHFLQTRPVTALPPPSDLQRNRIVWDNSNIQESYCGVTTPLTFSFASGAYATVYEQTMRLMRIPDQVIADHKEVLQNLLGLIKGRVYYNINNWYRGLLLLPSFSSNKADMERMMGLQDPVDFVEDKKLPLQQKLKKLPILVRTYGNLLVKFSQLDSLTTQFRQMFESEYKRIDRSRLHRLEITELLSLADHLEERVLKRWQTPIINDFYVMMYNGKVRKWLEKAGVPDPAELQNRLLSGEEGIESTIPAKEVIRLATIVRRSEKISRILTGTPVARIPAILRTEEPEFFKQCQHYIEQYGDRTMGELKLETITLRQDPSFLFGLLRSYLNSQELDLQLLHIKEKGMRAEAEKEAEAAIRKLKKPLALYRFRSDLNKFRKGVRNRENMRFARTRLFGLYRDIYLQIGLQMSFYGLLEHNRDVFYLTVTELRHYRDGKCVSADLKLLVAARKKEFSGYEQEDLPHHFTTTGLTYHQTNYKFQPAEKDVAQNINDEKCLQGTGCYPGIVEAEVRMVFTPAEALELEGQILCTLRTDPGWTPLFPVCKGIIVERGSTLSHSAVVARELGIPAIVNVPGLTKILRSGQQIRMNGGTGEIFLIKDSSEAV